MTPLKLLSSRSRRSGSNRGRWLLLTAALLGIGGCKPKPPESKAPPAPPASTYKEIPPILGGTAKLRLQIDFTVNPPYVGRNLAKLWVTDPSKTLLPVAKARVNLTLSPPAGILSPQVHASEVTDQNGRASAILPIVAPGKWTLMANVASPKNGKLSLSTQIPVRLLPGQKDTSVKAPVGPVRNPPKGQ